MKKYISFFKVLLLMSSVFMLHSCTAPKAYQKIFLNDSQMELSPGKVEQFEMNAQVYREGASGANGGKTGGGCGCN